jgi:TolB-like protein/tetratricopeptide (TPR) repeat protein
LINEPARAIFLSYASQDAETAQRICEGLLAAGIEVWFDRSELRGGDAWDRRIRQQIQDCALFIPIVSANSQARLEGYFRLEWRLAVERTHLMADAKPFLLPVVIDDTQDRDAEVPEAFRAVQWSRLPAGSLSPAFVERISRLLSPGSPHRAALHRPAAVAPSWQRPAALSIAAVALIGMGYLALDKFVLSKRSVPVVAQTAERAQPAKSIAVLPFVDMSEKKDQEYFSDGMSEEIIDLLVKIPELKVIGRTSSFSFKGKPDDLRAIGSALGAAYVVEGSVRRSGDHIRVTAQLIDARDGVHRWSETYDRDASDVLRVQDEIAASLVRALQVEVNPAMTASSRSQPKNFESYDLYLRGLHAADKFNQDGFEEAIVDFRRALELDPTFVPASEALTDNLMYLAGYAFVPSKSGYQAVREAAEATLKLNHDSAVAHAALANVYAWYDWNWAAAAQELKTAVALAPNNSLVLTAAAGERLIVGQYSEAARFIDIARAVDPLRPSVLEMSCWIYMPLGRLADAEQACRRALEVSDAMESGSYFLGVTLLLQGKPQAALVDMQKVTEPLDQLAGLALAYHALRRTKDADAALMRLTAQYANVQPATIAEVYAFRGENDQALRWLDTAYTQRDHDLVYIKSDPLLKNIQSDPRYGALLRKMNLPE